MQYRLLLLGLGGCLFLFLVIEVLVIKFNGTPVAAPAIPREPQRFGANGKPLTYVIMGDSTTIGQGTTYDQSYAVASAQHLGETRQITLVNVGVSGARVRDVLQYQLPQAIAYNPDLVLIAVGANDVTHLTSSKTIGTSLQSLVNELRRHNPQLGIVVTGSPAMGSVPRFPWPVKQLAGTRTGQVNRIFERLAAQNQLTFAPIAAKTGPAFLDNPGLFAVDKFHPNAEGYALWTPVITEALDQALSAHE